MKVLVAGAAGALGSRAAAALRASGHEVWGTTRGRTDALESGGIRPVVADLLDAGDAERAVASVRPDAVVQALNALPPAGPTKAEDLAATNRLRIDATRNLVAAASAAGVRRYVAESFVLVYGPRPDGSPAAGEEQRPARGLPAGLQPAVDALASLEEQVVAFGGVVLRFGLFFGHGIASNDALAARVARRAVPVFAFDGVQPFVHIDDAAAAVVAAVESDRRGAIYNIAATHATFREYVVEVAASVGAPPPRRLPRAAARLAGAYLAGMLKSNLSVTTDKAAAELGWKPVHATLRDGLAAR